jgi:ATP adenylyltransferase
VERKNLWAPWRMKYIKQLSKKTDCFLCDYHKTSEKDAENFVLWRTANCIVTFNRYPYNNGHLLIAPVRHIADLSETTEAEQLEIMKLIIASQKALNLAIDPHGFNVGINLSRCAGAGLPGHVHVHVVPRWDGDTNFMHVCSDTDVISQSMEELYEMMTKISDEQSLPGI